MPPSLQKKQVDVVSFPVFSGENGPRPKLANTGKQVLIFPATILRVPLVTKLIMSSQLRLSDIDFVIQRGTKISRFYGLLVRG